MSDLNWSPYISTGPRRVGKTTQICAAAKTIGATVVCLDSIDAKRVAAEHNVKTTSLLRPELLQGIWPRPVLLFDTDAVAHLCELYEHDIKALRMRARGLEQKLDAICNVIGGFVK